MFARPLVSVVATAASLVLAASPAMAQRTSPLPDRPARVVATYDFRNNPRDAALPRTVTVADSAGTIVARAELPGDRKAIPLTVTVMDNNLVLQGETADGVLTLVLDRQNEGGPTTFLSGRWTLGRTEGQLRGRVKP